MKVETKFDIGMRLWVSNSRTKMEKKDCPACLGKGQIELADGTYNCPKCKGLGSVETPTKATVLEAVPARIAGVYYNVTMISSGAVFHEIRYVIAAEPTSMLGDWSQTEMEVAGYFETGEYFLSEEEAAKHVEVVFKP